MLTTKVLPRQADVVDSAAALDGLRVGAALRGLVGGHPTLPPDTLPPPLRGCDGAGAGPQLPFAHRSVVERLPSILRNTVERNMFAPEVADRVLAVAEAAERGQAVVEELPPLTEADEAAVGASLAAACEEWRSLAAPLVGCNWLRVPWWFLENYAYHWLLLVTGYLRPSAAAGSHHAVPDPFAPHKQAALGQAWDVVRSALVPKARRAVADGVTHGLDSDAWSAALLVSLWANRFDLSLSGAQTVPAASAASMHRAHAAQGGSGEGQSPAAAALETHLVSDDRDALSAVLAPFGADDRPSVSWVVDNCGVELLGDLAAAATFLAAFPDSSATIYCKVRVWYLAPVGPSACGPPGRYVCMYVCLCERVYVCVLDLVVTVPTCPQAAPVFVSDATRDDVDRHIAWLEEQEEKEELGEGGRKLDLSDGVPASPCCRSPAVTPLPPPRFRRSPGWLPAVWNGERSPTRGAPPLPLRAKRVLAHAPGPGAQFRRTQLARGQGRRCVSRGGVGTRFDKGMRQH